MRVELGHRGDYAVRAVLYLARHPGLHRGAVIADAMAIPVDFLPQVLGALSRARVVRSTLGRRGGYELARDADEITLYEVIEAAEGSVDSRRCMLRGGPCHGANQCAVHDTWTAASRALARRLAATTFADLAAEDLALEQHRSVGSRLPVQLSGGAPGEPA